MRETLKPLSEIEKEKPYRVREIDIAHIEERTRIFLATAKASDQIRRMVHYGSFELQNSADAYFRLHTIHTAHNPREAYSQEDIPKRKNRDKDEYELNYWHYQPGQMRRVAVQVGCFNCLSPEYLPRMGDSFFQSLDMILQASKNFPLVENDVLSLLTLLDQFLTVTHLVENASGRTNEDFLHAIARELGINWSVSDCGFRGQLDDSFETQIESARWVTRSLAAEENIYTFANQLLEYLRNIAKAVRKRSKTDLNQAFLKYEQDELIAPAAAALFDSFQNCQIRPYALLPANNRVCEFMTIIVTHLALAAKEFESTNIKIMKVERAYIRWHLNHARIHLAQLVKNQKILKNVPVASHEADSFLYLTQQMEQKLMDLEDDLSVGSRELNPRAH